MNPLASWVVPRTKPIAPNEPSRAERTFMALGSGTRPHENGRVRSCIDAVVSHPIFRGSQSRRTKPIAPNEPDRAERTRSRRTKPIAPNEPIGGLDDAGRACGPRGWPRTACLSGSPSHERLEGGPRPVPRPAPSAGPHRARCAARTGEPVRGHSTNPIAPNEPSRTERTRFAERTRSLREPNPGCAERTEFSRLHLRRGLSATEVIVLVAIVVVIGLFVLMALPRGRETARIASCRKNLMQIGRALAHYDRDVGHLPTVAEPRKDGGGDGPLKVLLENSPYRTSPRSRVNGPRRPNVRTRSAASVGSRASSARATGTRPRRASRRRSATGPRPATLPTAGTGPSLPADGSRSP